MFTPTIRSFFCTAGLFLLTLGYGLLAQELNADLQKKRKQSVASFEEGDFRSALTGFRELLVHMPKDAMINYYTGICLVELNEDLDDAIELLYGASKRNVPSSVNFYLGMAYHRDYNFFDAQKYYEQFEIEASRQEIKEYDVKLQMRTVRSAREITTTYNPFEVMNVTFIDLFDSLQFTQVKMKGGQLKRKPESYFSADEDREGLTSMMFIPRTVYKGDYMYYSGYDRSGKDGTQLFRVRKGPGRAWGTPEEVRALNTPGNEILPYFDPIEDDLYFASDGMMGVGGFDLYRSHYDSERDQWSEPTNLGFPVNSVMDEYLLLPGTDLGMVMFFSSRQGTDSTVTVYRVHLAEPKKKIEPNDNRMLKEVAYLGGVAAEILADLAELDSRDKSKDMVGEPAESSAERVPPAITPVTILSESGAQSEYQSILAEALNYQAASDSLKDLASNARFLVKDSDDPNDRWVWQKQIMLWEKRANDEEAMADELFTRLDVERSGQQIKPAVNVPETIEVERVKEDLTVYRYTEPASPPMSQFDILAQSPYNENNPFPMDESLPQGTFYRIQVGAVGSEAEFNAFKGITPISGERIPERQIIKYYAGKFAIYADASSALPRIRSNGFEDAFIVAWYNGNPVSTQRAKQLE